MDIRKFVSSMVLFIFLVSSVTLVASCNSSNTSKNAENQVTDKQNDVEESGKETSKILLYISGPEEMVTKFENAFEEKHGDVLDVYHNGCGPIKQKLWSEMESGGIEADVVLQQNLL